MVILHLEFFVVYTIKSFALEGKKCNILRDIYCGNQSGRQEEIVAKVARELQHSSEWSETNSLLLFWDKIYVSQISNLRYHIVSLYYNTKVVEHVE